MGSSKYRGGLGDALFTKTQQRVLGVLFGNPHQSYYTNELIQLANIGTGAVRRELEKLSAAELINRKRIGNQTHYQANAQSPIFEELCSIVRKTFGLSDELARALRLLGDRVEVAFIFGSVASEQDRASSDVDLFVLGRELSYVDVMGALEEAERTLERRVNPTLYTGEELLRKLEGGNSFLRRVLDQPKVFLVGSERELAHSF